MAESAVELQRLAGGHPVADEGGKMRRRSVVVAVVVILVLALASTVSAGASGAEGGTTKPAGRTPEVSGPTTGGKGIQAIGISYDFESVGYVFEEFFVEGDAAGYEKVGDLPRKGRWRVKETDTAPFKTRMVVVRPKDPTDFNGTVVVEWFNVTGGVDAGPTFLNGHNQILRSGAAWVGVTTQAVGVNGAAETVQSNTVDIPEGGLKASDPDRYGTLSHPGDLYANDIFTQAGKVIRGEGKGVDPFEGFDVKRLIAAGESQSAGRLTTYVNAVQPLAKEYDGFLIYSRGATPAPLGERQPDVVDPDIPEGAQIRRDLNVPVFTFETEYDVSVLGYADARQPDSKSFRAWEVTGGSHQDAYTATGTSLTDLGDGSAEAKLLDPAQAGPGALGCVDPINAGDHYAPLQAALAHLETWVRKGTAPPKFPRVKTSGTGDNIEVVRDDLGIAKGGVRTPIVTVPLAANIGDATNSPGFCRVFGHTRPFDSATLTKLYPNGSSDYVTKFEKAADRAVKAGMWLEPEAENFKKAARGITLP
jgi:hypothetical protein